MHNSYNQGGLGWNLIPWDHIFDASPKTWGFCIKKYSIGNCFPVKHIFLKHHHFIFTVFDHLIRFPINNIYWKWFIFIELSAKFDIVWDSALLQPGVKATFSCTFKLGKLDTSVIQHVFLWHLQRFLSGSQRVWHIELH